jgi:hypothetical protein
LVTQEEVNIRKQLVSYNFRGICPIDVHHSAEMSKFADLNLNDGGAHYPERSFQRRSILTELGDEGVLQDCRIVLFKGVHPSLQSAGVGTTGTARCTDLLLLSPDLLHGQHAASFPRQLGPGLSNNFVLISDILETFF